MLRCLRSYLVIDMYFALEVHTEDTIAAGRAEVLNFSSLIKVILDILHFANFN